MTRLALLAVLLLALAPSVSRVLASGSTQLLAGWSELCTTMGLQTLPSEARSLDGSPASVLPPGGELCDYCPLAAALSLLVLFVALVLPVLNGSRGFDLGITRARSFANFRGLGSQGPPILL